MTAYTVKPCPQGYIVHETPTGEQPHIKVEVLKDEQELAEYFRALKDNG